MTQLIDPKKFTTAVTVLRSFFLSKGFVEVHTQNRLAILGIYEIPHRILSELIIVVTPHYVYTIPHKKGFVNS